MKWVTRQNANVDRIACPWLIRRFIDPDAEFLYAPRDLVLEVAEREGAHSYDAPGAKYTHRDGKCSFDVLVEDYKLGADPALVRMAEVRGAGPVRHRPRVRPPARHRRSREDQARDADVRRAVRLVPAGNLRMISRPRSRPPGPGLAAGAAGLPARRP